MVKYIWHGAGGLCVRCILLPQAHVQREKEIQAECSSCFMVNLVASYKDSAYLFMLLECVMGGELFTYLQVMHIPLPPPPPRYR